MVRTGGGLPSVPGKTAIDFLEIRALKLFDRRLLFPNFHHNYGLSLIREYEAHVIHIKHGRCRVYMEKAWEVMELSNYQSMPKIRI